MKAVVAAFNQEKALVGAFSVITNLRMELFQALLKCRHDHLCFNVSCLYADTSGSVLQIISGDVPCSLNKNLLSTNIFVKYHLLLKVASSHLIFKCSKFVFVCPASTDGQADVVARECFYFLLWSRFCDTEALLQSTTAVELEMKAIRRFAKHSVL